MKKPRIPNPSLFFGELKYRHREKRRMNAIPKAARAYLGYAAQKGYSGRILNEITSFTDKLGLSKSETAFSRNSRIGKVLSERLVTFHGPKSIAKRIIVVPENSPYYKKLFETHDGFGAGALHSKNEAHIPATDGFPSINISANQFILLPEPLLKEPPERFRRILSHEISHLLLGCNEVVSYAISETESFERAKRDGDKRIGKAMDTIKLFGEKAKSSANKKYAEELKTGFYAARIAAELGVAIGGNAKEEFIFRLIEKNPSTQKEIETIRDEIVGRK